MNGKRMSPNFIIVYDRNVSPYKPYNLDQRFELSALLNQIFVSLMNCAARLTGGRSEGMTVFSRDKGVIQVIG